MSPLILCSNLLFLLLCSSAFTSSNELNSLLTIKSSLQSSNSNLFSSWNPSNPTCNFTGISCNKLGNTIEIDLSKQRLSGTLRFDAICSLSSLKKLAVGYNSLSGNITEDIRNCTQLEYLDLGNNNFSSLIPNFSSLTQLKFLYLQLSGFFGVFPWNSFTKITSLVELNIGDNPFDITTFPKQILQLKKLNVLYLYNCSISGQIPSEIGNLTDLIDLELSQNFLSGSIPLEISNLKNLKYLKIWGNNLTGKLPFGFRNLINLEQFDACNNRLEGDLSEMKFLNKLVWLQLYNNNFSGKIPAEFGEFKSLTNLSLYNNKFTGELPLKLGSWTEFDFIDVSANHLSGPIPPDMCRKGTMTKLLMLQNNFSGEIPVSYANCKTLTRFRVSQNSLTGKVPDGIWGLPNVDIIDIANNFLHGSITGDINQAKNLLQIYGSNNKLSGNLPLEISGASSLGLIDLSNNQLTGKIPESIGDLKNLSTLNLQENQLSGNIPNSIENCLQMGDLNLAGNSFSGQIPSFGSSNNLYSLNLSHNQLSGEIPSSVSSLHFSVLDLSYNKLSGSIPEFLTIEAYKDSFVGNNGLCSRKYTNFLRPCSWRSQKHHHMIVVFVVIGLCMLVVLMGFYMYKILYAAKKDQNLPLFMTDDNNWSMDSYHVLNFTKEEILESIKPENLIGKGGCGNVYKVGLKDGKVVAVKHVCYTNLSNYSKFNAVAHTYAPMLDKNSSWNRTKSSKIKEFEMEIETLSCIRHVNIVKLYCSITSKDSSLLVYEYLSNGSVWDRLHHSDTGLDWLGRYEIGLGAARGLEYLHHGYEKPVIHRDVKSSNILLDASLKPKIADFGLAKIVQEDGVGLDSSHVIAGTHGYIAPEYGYTLKVNEKSDIYSFGVVLLELVTGKKAIEPEFGDNDIVSWVSSKLTNTNHIIQSIIDPTILESHKEKMVKMLRIAILCTSKLPERRPTMRSVVQMLEEIEPYKLVTHNVKIRF
ncbi:unnamed protein product [Amaranthus hypochondriacus]